jgi:hypothetical protein
MDNLFSAAVEDFLTALQRRYTAAQIVLALVSNGSLVHTLVSDDFSRWRIMWNTLHCLKKENERRFLSALHMLNFLVLLPCGSRK